MGSRGSKPPTVVGWMFASRRRDSDVHSNVVGIAVCVRGLDELGRVFGGRRRWLICQRPTAVWVAFPSRRVMVMKTDAPRSPWWWSGHEAEIAEGGGDGDW